MRVMYFNIDNGACVKPFTVLPAYRAYVTGSKIHMIEACFNVGNITGNGYEWFLNQVEKDFNNWDFQHPYLMRSLKNLAMRESFKYLFKYSNFQATNHRFPYVPIWINGMKYGKNHFLDS